MLAMLLFLGLPLLVAAVAVPVLERLNERMDNREAENKKTATTARAADLADEEASRVKRARARKETLETPAAAVVPAEDDSDRLEREAFAERHNTSFDIPRDFNLAEFSGRSEPLQA